MHELIAVILAGGASRRFGRDKAAEPVDGQASLARVAAAAAAAGPVVVVGGTSELPNGIERLADLEPGGGPVQAVVAAFRRFPTSSLLVLACDLPRLSEAAVRLLARPLDAEIDARLPLVEGCPQPLAALYGPGCATVLEASLATGERSMARSLARLRVEWLEIDAQHHPELACALQDFDTPEDLAGLR